ncbi:MAG: hypothetical protein ACRDZ9_05825 [Acidimicrobiales bacterium]
MPLRPRTATAAVVVAVVVAVGAVLTPTRPAAAAPKVEVEAGHDGFYRPGAAVPVRVTVRADRLVRATLAVRVGSPGGVDEQVERRVEVPGGSVKEYVVMVPTSPLLGANEARAELVGGDGTEATGRARLRQALDQELVGLLPAVLGGRPAPAPAPLAVDAGTARFVALDDALLAAAPAALASLGTVGSAAGEVAALAHRERRAVLGWVAGGGHLLVDTDPGTEVPGLPPAWQPGQDGRAAAGLGQVRATGVAMATGRWAGLVEPTPLTTVTSRSGFVGEPAEVALAGDAGLRVPELGWLLGFLALYVVVAVPVVLTVLRRGGRGELGWVALPALALAFAAAGYLAGRGLRSGATVAHGTILQTTAVGAQASVTLGVVSRSGGTVRTSYPPGWQVAGTPADPFWGGNPLGSDLVVALGADQVVSRTRLATGQFSVQTGTGPVGLDGGLEVTAASPADGQVRGLVRNTLPFALDQVAVLTATGATSLGRLGPGRERPWSLALDDEADPGLGPGPAAETWPAAAGLTEPPDPTDVVNFSLWSTLEQRSPSGFLASGSVVAAGWTRSYRPPVDPEGRLARGRTLVTTTAAVRPEAVAVTDASVRTEAVRDPFTEAVVAAGPAEPVPGGSERVTRFVLPDPDGGTPAVDPSSLVVRAPRPGLGLEVWREGAWRPLAAPPGPRPGQARPPAPPGADVVGPLGPVPLVDHPLSPADVTDGVVWVRTTPDPSAPVLLADLVTLGPAP